MWSFLLSYSALWFFICCSHHIAWLIEMYIVIYLFCKLAFPQLTTFLIFYRKRRWYLSYLLIWSHFPFPILLLKTVVRYWDSSCLGQECFPLEMSLTSHHYLLLLHDVIFSHFWCAHKGFGRFQLKTLSPVGGWKIPTVWRSCSSWLMSQELRFEVLISEHKR